MYVIPVSTIGRYERPAMTDNECIEWVAGLEFEACNADGNDLLSRDEIADALRLELGRDPAEDEVTVRRSIRSHTESLSPH